MIVRTASIIIGTKQLNAHINYIMVYIVLLQCFQTVYFAVL